MPAHRPCCVLAVMASAAAAAHAQLARFDPTECNLTGILEGDAFDPDTMEFFTVEGTSTVQFTDTVAGGGTSGGLVGIMACQVDMLGEVIDGRGVEPTRIVITSTATASFNPDYIGSISGAFQLNLVFNLTSATPFSIVQSGDPGSIGLIAQSGEIVGDTLLAGSYRISHNDGAFASDTIPSHASSGTWTLYLPAPSAAAPLALATLLLTRRRR